MPTDIKLKNSVTATNAPTSLQQGEVAINITDKKVWVGNAATTPVLLLGSGADGTFTNLTVSGVASFADGTVSLPSITNIGDTNTGIFFPAADTIAFTEGGVESMRITSAGRLGIGTTAPAELLDVRGAISAGNGGNGTLLTGTNGVDSDFTLAIASSVTRFTNSVAAFAFNTGGSERMRIDSSGNVLVGGTTQRLSAKITNNGTYWSGSGNSSGDAEYFLSNYATPTCAWAMSVRQDVGGANNNLKFLRLNSSGTFQDVAMQITQAEGNVNLNKNLGIGGATATTSGTGITFPATQSASSNANTLDDYEEGTFTPSVGGTATYASDNYGLYTKIGNVVTCQFRISILLIGTGSAGSIQGLPFTSANISNVQTGCVSYYDQLAINTIFVAFYVENNATSLQFVSKATSGNIVDNGPALMGNGTDILCSVTYRVA